MDMLDIYTDHLICQNKYATATEWLYRNCRGICNDPGPRPSLRLVRHQHLILG